MFAKKTWIACACAGLMIGGSALAQEEAKKPALETLEEKASYVIGLNIGGDFNSRGFELALEQFVQGIKDGIAEAEPALSDADIQATMGEFQQVLQQKMMEKAEADQKAGAEFLTENGKREGVKTTASGLQYEVIEEGDGAVPVATSAVSVHYTGKLVDGTVFDSSEGRDPIKLDYLVDGDGNGSVIQGWVEALQLMKVGSKWRIYIPSELGYGARGAGGAIPPNATLIFDVELVSIDN